MQAATCTALPLWEEQFSAVRTDGCGTVFELSQTNGTWAETILHSFSGGSEGAFPWGAPLLDRNRNLYITVDGAGCAEGREQLLPRLRGRQPAEKRGIQQQRAPVPPAEYNGFPTWNLPTGHQEPDPRGSKANECYTHDSLVTSASGDKGVSWRHYTPTVSNPSNPLGIIWDAPEGIPEVCYGQNEATGNPCSGSEFTSHVVYPEENQFGFNYDGAPILDDIATCSLQKISWVIPDEAWSDHPFSNVNNSPPYGPSWVGNIINAIGQSYANSGGKCDYWGFGTGSTSPEPTAIFVVWDDWGGFFDHVAPPEALEENPQTGYTSCDPNSQWGCGYVYGMRVPLMVVSEYTPAGYVSGAFPSPGKTFPYVHDFGSILRFAEFNFGMGLVYPLTNYYADANAPDGAEGNTPLSDFFNTSTPRGFTTISTPYPPSKFRNYYTTPQNGVYPTPTGPDGSPGEEDD